ncbi:hypothetical protein NADE_000913 [Nannochloris sp. 'desiccata']|nr:hypothetical protein KSW81_003584 [Chlorella desiccata (nom. nud.)]KAH7616078.1 hypothetical protein NADE_000913 [Chlorella desiccata (nom. nud.)]
MEFLNHHGVGRGQHSRAVVVAQPQEVLKTPPPLPRRPSALLHKGDEEHMFPPLMFSRRSALGSMTAATATTTFMKPLSASAAAPGSSENLYLLPRLDAVPGSISQPSYLAPWDPKTIYYPRWLFGQWNVTSTFTSVATPLKKYVPEGFLQQANAPSEDGGVGSTYNYALRFYSTLPDTFSNNARFMLGLGYPEDAIIADKAFNTKQTSDAFLGYTGAVASVEFDPRDAPLRQTVELSRLGPDMVPLPPRRIELYVNALKSEQPGGVEGDGKIFVTSELARQVLVAVRDVQVTDYEVINEYRLIAPGKIEGRQRSLLYLTPQDPNYFRAGNKAVTMYDYAFTMTRESPEADAPQGAVACVPTPKDVIQCL